MAHSRTLFQRVGYDALRLLCRVYGVVLFGLRCRGRQRIPQSGPVLVCANHQSFLDPVLVGLTCNRRLNYLARASLFRHATLRWLIQFLDAIPIEREGMGLGGLRESLRRIRSGEMVLIFPEGTRTISGEVAHLESGFCMLARRGDPTLLPVGIDGAFDAWPKGRRLPRLARIHLCVGQPITADWIRQASDAQLVAELEARIRQCHAHARRGRGVPARPRRRDARAQPRVAG
jgi:1-acyl-sn-glycerol-3-phosphate acyltransferase